ncbi:MAG: glycosyltransferase family 4 protein [Sphingomonadales bacterium]|nr:glycosyltransferase family 4 protein [Sphingomonadales bacterium]MBU3993924.1 glycosyltransferase family 4 protein [Alphaproteobacteria bacterium]
MPESSEEVAAAVPASRPAILLYAQSNFGGLAEHTHYQAQELADRGWPITVLCHPDFLRRPSQPRYRRRAVLHTVTGTSRLAKLLHVAAVVLDHYVLAWWIMRTRPAVVLFDCASEYFMPFWVWPHLLLRRTGVHYLANFHDPVRERHFGPHWLHRWSLRLMYRLIEGGLVHGPVPPEAAIPANIRLVEAPLGPFEDTLLIPPSVDIRTQFAIPESSCVVLAFGHIVDRKNLDHLIRAVAQVPGTVLVIAGEHSSATQRPAAYYRQIAAELGIAARVIFCEEFIPDDRIAEFFTAADIVALTYRSAFVSQSGVLQQAVAFRKPVLVSCGPGPLRQTMEQFPLGMLIPPDDVAAIADGLRELRAAPPVPEAVFRAYESAASWPANIDRLIELIGTVSNHAKIR